MTSIEQLETRIRNVSNQPALIAYTTAGYPDMDRWWSNLLQLATVADVIEIGIPFSNPTADGATLQRVSLDSLRAGFRFEAMLERLRSHRFDIPLLWMGYVNPFLRRGWSKLTEEASEVGISGFIIPDLPMEESGELREHARIAGLAVVQLVAPNTPTSRLSQLGQISTGFTYAVTVTGITGSALPSNLAATLERVRHVSRAPVCAGFGIRTRDDVSRLAPLVDGVIVGTALVNAIDRGEDPADFLRGLRS